MVKSAFVAGSTTLFGDVLYLLVRTVGEISGIGVGCHDVLINRQLEKLFVLIRN